MATKTQQEQSTLQELVNVPVTVKAFGKKYEIQKFNLGQTTRALEYIGTFRYAISALTRPDADVVSILLGAIAVSGDTALGLISVATSEPVEWLETQDTMEGLEVLTAVIEKNADFFSQENIQRVKGMFGRLQSKIPALGGDTSTPSSDTDTAL
jgi:hypothetical protein